GEMTAMDVGADDVGGGGLIAHIEHVVDRVVAKIDARRETGAITVAPIEDHPLIELDALAQTVRLDIGDKRVELLALHQREDVRERVEFELLLASHYAASPSRLARARWMALSLLRHNRRPARCAGPSPAQSAGAMLKPCSGNHDIKRSTWRCSAARNSALEHPGRKRSRISKRQLSAGA